MSCWVDRSYLISEEQEGKERERKIGLEKEGEGEVRKRKATVWGNGSFLNFVKVLPA